MARNTFHVDQEQLRTELSALGDDELQDRYNAAWEDVFGTDSMSEDMVQDCAWLEEDRIRNRAIMKITGEIQEERAAMRNSTQTDVDTSSLEL